MIVSNAIPKAGGHFLFAYLTACGLAPEPGELYADIDVTSRLRFTRRPLGGSTKEVWDGPCRSPKAMLADRSAGRVVNAHVHDRIALTGHRVAFIYRHPRNVLISAARFSAVQFDWTRDEPDPDDVSAILGSDHAVAVTVGRCRAFLGWLKKAEVAVRFEDFVERPGETAEQVSGALGLPVADPAAVWGEKAPRVSSAYHGTWSGRLSRWEEFWSAHVDALWTRLGGRDVERVYGYAT